MLLNRFTHGIPCDEKELTKVMYGTKSHVFLNPSEFFNKASCNHEFVVKLKHPKFEGVNYQFYCAECGTSNVKVDDTSENIIHFENLEFDSNSILNKMAMLRTALEMVREKNGDQLNISEIVEEINNEVNKNTDSVKIKVLSVCERYKSFGTPREIPK